MKPSDMVQQLETFLKSSDAGVKMVVVDGQTITFDRAQALAELQFWQREAARQAGKRKLFRGVNVGSAY